MKAEFGGWTLGAILNKYQSIYELGYYSYTKLYQAGV